MDTKQKYVGMERHMISVVTLIITALIVWVGSNVQKTQVELAAISVELKYLRTSIDDDSEKFQAIESRLDSIERQLSALKDGHD